MPLRQYTANYYVPGSNPVLTAKYDPATMSRVLTLFGVVGLSDLGHHYPFINGATATTPLTTGNLAGGKHEYDTFEITASNTITVTSSPLWIACRRFKINTGGILDLDGIGGAGGAAGIPGNAGSNSYTNTSGYYGLGGGGGDRKSGV